jgi:hypothetical protein
MLLLVYVRLLSDETHALRDTKPGTASFLKLCPRSFEMGIVGDKKSKLLPVAGDLSLEFLVGSHLA